MDVEQTLNVLTGVMEGAPAIFGDRFGGEVKDAFSHAIAIIKAANEWQTVRSAIADGFNSSEEYEEARYNLVKAEQDLLSLLSPVEQTKEV